MTPLTRSLLDRLPACTNQRLSFAEVMNSALYHPELGYYGAGPRRIGRSGDFYTAVSVGPLYGQLLADLAAQVRQEMGGSGDFAVIEQAAHDGQLAEDILRASAGAEAPDYWIVEPNPRYQEVQRERLAPFSNRVHWVTTLGELPPLRALFLCNELPDALPVHLVRWTGAAWEELYVSAGTETALDFVGGAPSTERLAAELAGLPKDLPIGYTTEVGLAAQDWMSELAAAAFHGQIYIADYGFDDEELYAPERSTGTLRRYHKHVTDDQVLEDLGEADLTVHVNFSQLIRAAEAGGLKVRGYEHQGRFLGKLGLRWLSGLEGRAPDPATQASLRQYQSLTHPAFMGRSFRVLLLEKP